MKGAKNENTNKKRIPEKHRLVGSLRRYPIAAAKLYQQGPDCGRKKKAA
jgi:hypothetical protein